MRRLMLLILIVGQSVTAQNTAKTLDEEKTELRIENTLRNDFDSYRREIDAKMATEVAAHRQYLEGLDQRLYERLQVLLPTFSIVVALMVAVFLWQVGKTQKEAFESAQAIASAKATELAQKKVLEILLPEKIISEVQKISVDTVTQIQLLRSTLISSVTEELEKTRSEVLRNKETIIEETLTEAIKTQFKEPLDVLARLKGIEERVTSLSNRIAKLETLSGVEELEMKIERPREPKVGIKDLTLSSKIAVEVASLLLKAVRPFM